MHNFGLLLRACQNVVKPRCTDIHLVWRQACLAVAALKGVRHACSCAGLSITPSLVSFICPHRTKPVQYNLLLTSHNFQLWRRKKLQSILRSVCTHTLESNVQLNGYQPLRVCMPRRHLREWNSKRENERVRERKLLAVSSTTQQAFSTFVPLKHGCYSKSLRLLIFSSQIWL